MSMTDRNQDIANGARKAGDAIRDTFDDVVTNGPEKARRALSKSKDTLDHAMDVASEGADKAQAYVSRQMQERPVTAAATALGAGILIGLLLARRS